MKIMKNKEIKEISPVDKFQMIKKLKLKIKNLMYSQIKNTFEQWKPIEKDLLRFFKENISNEFKIRNKDYLDHCLFYTYCTGFSKLLFGKDEKFVRTINYLLEYLMLYYIREKDNNKKN